MNAVDEHPIATSSFEHQGPRWAMPPGRSMKKSFGDAEVSSPDDFEIF